MSDARDSTPSFVKEEIQANPEYHIAWVLSEMLNDGAPIAWGKYRWMARTLLGEFDVKRKAPSVSVEDATSAPLCSCEEWEPGLAKINAPILLAQARNPALTQTPEFQFVAFRFCPWCGERSRVAPSSTERSPE